MEKSKQERYSRRLRWDELDPAALRALVRLAAAEDLDGAGLASPPARPGDVTTDLLDPARPGRAVLAARRELVACGLGLVPLVLAEYGGAGRFEAAARDGQTVPAGEPLGWLAGPAAQLITAERVLLNFLQKLSGIATHTARHVAALGASPTRLLDTRKTTPGYRALEKYAVACGGAWNHRLGLYDRVLLKDNHLAAAGATEGEPLAGAVRRARALHPELPVEVEVDRLSQVEPVVAAGADIILLDNFSVPDTREAVTLIAGRCATEGSGGLTLATLPERGALGLDFLSVGGLVHQATWVDIGLDWC